MKAVIQLRDDVARLMQGEVGLDRSTDQCAKIKQDLDSELVRLGVSLRPMHPGAEDAELARYFTLSGTVSMEDERILATLRNLEAVTAAYIKPEAEPA